MGRKTMLKPGKDTWLQSVWDVAGELCREAPYALQITMVATTRPGVFSFRARALHTADGKPCGVAAQVQGEYPNASNAELGAFLYNLCIKLDAVLAQEIFSGDA